MRKVSAIVLLFVLFLYHLGYYGFYLALSHQLDKEWNTKIFQGQKIEEKLMHTAIPLSIPYQPDQASYQPHSGKVNIEGQYYRIVKQKYAQDTLHILYVNDSLQTELDASVNQWMASILQSSGNNDGQDFQIWKVLAKDFIIDEFWVYAKPERLLAQLPYSYQTEKEYTSHILITTPPPKQA